MHIVSPNTIDTLEDALRFVESLDVSAMKLGLARVARVLASLGHPQDRMPTVHVAGTNGKGSVVAMLGSVLKSAGLSVGTFTSPHLVHMRERIALNGNPILADDFTVAVASLKSHLENAETSRDEWPTYFEFLYILAVRYFLEKNVDAVVIETGLGGRLDATNAVRCPNLTIITGIALDHTHHLGDTTAAIAAEKAGILKAGAPLVLGGAMDTDARRVILARAAALGVPVTQASPARLVIEPADPSHAELTLTLRDTESGGRYALSLAAPYQRDNLAVVLEAVHSLRAQEFDISNEAVQHGLAHTYWPARFQWFASQRLIVDGSHNAQGFAALDDALRHHFADRPIHWLLSLRTSRPADDLLRLPRDWPATASAIWTVGEPAHLYYPFEALEASNCGSVPIQSITNPTEALKAWRARVAGDADAIGVMTGSLYTAGIALKQIDRR